MESGFLPPELFARLNQHSSDTVLTRCLFFDSLCIHRWVGALGSYDTKSCYDRFTHSITSIMAQSLGTPSQLIDCMFQTIQQIEFHLRTGYGNSVQTFGSDIQHSFQTLANLPSQGLFQGKGGALAL